MSQLSTKEQRELEEYRKELESDNQRILREFESTVLVDLETIRTEAVEKHKEELVNENNESYQAFVDSTVRKISAMTRKANAISKESEIIEKGLKLFLEKFVVEMGIQDIYPHVKKNCKTAIRTVKLADYQGKKIAIDGPAQVYKALARGDETGGYLVYCAEQYKDLVAAGIKPVYVFDGIPPPAKQKELERREAIKENHRQEVRKKEGDLKALKEKEGLDGAVRIKGSPLKNTIGKITPEKRTEIEKMEEDLDKLKTKVTLATPEHKRNIRDLLKLMGAEVVQAHSEGEATCAVMNRLGQVEAVVADDGDVMAFGGIKLIRGLGNSYNREDNLCEYNIPEILQCLGLTREQFVEVAILCGCDFSDKIKGIGPVGAVEYVQKYYIIENILEKLPPKLKAQVPVEFEYVAARNVFYEYLYQKEPFPNTVDIPTTQYDHEAVVAFLRERNVPLYRETSACWCKELTGVYPKRRYDQWSDDETEESTPTSKKAKTPVKENSPIKENNTPVRSESVKIESPLKMENSNKIASPKIESPLKNTPLKSFDSVFGDIDSNLENNENNEQKPGIIQRIEGKEGRVRSQMMGMRAAFTERAIIPDSLILNVDEPQAQ